MANLIQCTVYQIDGAPLQSPVTIDFQTSDILVREVSINIAAVNTAIQLYNNPNNALGFKTYYVSESVASIVSDANFGEVSLTPATVLEVNGDPQPPGGFDYAFPCKQIVVSSTINPTTGVNATIAFKGVNYAVSQTQATIFNGSNLTGYVLNELSTPGFYADVYANIPAAGTQPGRMFIATDTFAFYRDNGVSWDLIGGTGTGVAGSGTATQIAFWDGPTSLAGDVNLYWDNANNRLGVGTSSPAQSIDTAGQVRIQTINNPGLDTDRFLVSNVGVVSYRTGAEVLSDIGGQAAISLTTTGSSGAATFVGATLNVPNYTLSGLGGVPSTRNITINGTTQDLSADRTYTIPAIASLNGLTATTQTFAVGTTGTDFSISSATSTHTFNLPTASASARGALSAGDWTIFNNKQNALSLTTLGTNGAATLVGSTLNIPFYTLTGLGGVPATRNITINGTTQDLSADRTYTIPAIGSLNGLTAASQTFAVGTAGTDFAISSATSTHTFNLPTASAVNRGALSSADWSTFNSKQDGFSLTTTGSFGAATFIANTLNIPNYAISLTTTGSSGAATFIANTLNIPNYTLSGLGGVPTTRNITINGVTQDLSADRTWTVTTSGQTLNDVTLLGNTSAQNIELTGGAFYRMQDVGSSDTLIFGVNSNVINMSYLISGDILFTADNTGIVFGNQGTVQHCNLRTNNFTAARDFEMPDATGTPTIPISVNGVTASTAGNISIPIGGTQTLQQTTTLGNTTTDDIVLNASSLQGADTIDFSIAPLLTAQAEGRARWDSFYHQLQTDTDVTGVSVTVGSDVIHRVINNTGSTIVKGRAVYINGSSGGYPTIALADNTDQNTVLVAGLVMADITTGSQGYIISEGVLVGINNNVGWSAGQVVYLTTNGQLSSTKAILPNYQVILGEMVTIGAVSGSIMVQIRQGASDAPRCYNLSFNNIANYVVTGGSGVQNLGAGTLGMSVFSPINMTLYRGGPATSYAYQATVITCEEYGGVTCTIGLRVTYSSSAGSTSIDSTASATRTAEFGSNYAVQKVDLSFSVPNTVSGSPTDLVKFEVLMDRATAGNTSVYLSQVIFN